MRIARPSGLSPDGKYLLVVTDDGVEFAMAVDARLRAALRDDRPRLGQLEIDMDSALRPREIQARIRAGETIDEVAAAAGVPVERVEPFAAPVIAEREHIATLASTQPVRRTGETVAHRSLRAVVAERLLDRGLDVDAVSWDAWRVEDRRWLVKLTFEAESAVREAVFTYDQTGRFSVATNEDARWILGEGQGSASSRRRRGEIPDAEPTIGLNDELALVRAIQPPADEPADSQVDNEDAYTPAELEEVDGVYDLVPNDRTNLDVLYDMLSSFDEDSVQIYAGLIRPATPGSEPVPVLDEDLDGEPNRPTSVSDDADEIAGAPIPARPRATDPPVPAWRTATERSRPVPDTPAATPVEPPEPEQPRLVNDLDEVIPEPTRPIRRKRASVPSWDEIMFGSPTPTPTPKQH